MMLIIYFVFSDVKRKEDDRQTLFTNLSTIVLKVKCMLGWSGLFVYSYLCV